MKLMVQPGDGSALLIKGMNSAKSSIEIVIFRFDRTEIERALANAVKRGVFVHALVAHMNRSGEDGLRDLEMRLLAAGVNVARTSNDLVRYHGKFMIVDRHELYLFAFNLTYLDIERSRSFGIVTTNPKLVHEAVRLFESDTKRKSYEAGASNLVVSPVNARRALSSFIQGAKRELLVYDPSISDPAMIRILEERSRSGVEIRIIGKLKGAGARLPARKLPHLRLHARTMIRDGEDAFIGSQSLRETELDARREVGVIFRDRGIAKRLSQTFQEDWALTDQLKEEACNDEGQAAAKVAKKIAKAVTNGLAPVAPVLEAVIRKMSGVNAEVDFDAQAVEASVKDAVKAAVKDVVKDVVEDTVQQTEDQRAESKARGASKEIEAS